MFVGFPKFCKHIYTQYDYRMLPPTLCGEGNYNAWNNTCQNYYPHHETQMEGYGNHLVCLSVCVCLQNLVKIMNIGGSNELLADFKLYKVQKEQDEFAKTLQL